MYDMAAKKQKKAQTPVRYGANLTVWIDPSIKKRLTDLVKIHTPRTTLTGMVELALTRLLNDLEQK